VGGCALNSTRIYPEWFSKHIVSDSNQHLIVGFGEGKSKEEAKQNALRGISEQIKLQVNSSSSSRKTVDRINKEESFQSSFEEKVALYSSSDLSGAKLLKESYLDGIYYLSYGFDNRSLPLKIKGLSCKTKRIGDDFKSHLPINRATACQWALEYRQNSWYLDIGSKSITLRDIDLFNNFFLSASNNRLKVDISPSNRVQNGDYYHIEITSKNLNFISMFLINELGQVQVLFANRESKGDSYIFPDLKQYNGLLAHKDIEDKRATQRDMLLVFNCKNQNSDLESFTPVHKNIISKNTTTFLYGKLLEVGKNCKWSSRFIYIN
jgi:hypothetical protein